MNDTNLPSKDEFIRLLTQKQSQNQDVIEEKNIACLLDKYWEKQAYIDRDTPEASDDFKFSKNPQLVDVLVNMYDKPELLNKLSQIALSDKYKEQAADLLYYPDREDFFLYEDNVEREYDDEAYEEAIEKYKADLNSLSETSEKEKPIRENYAQELKELKKFYETIDEYIEHRKPFIDNSHNTLSLIFKENPELSKTIGLSQCTKATMQDLNQLFEVGKALNHQLGVDVAINGIPQEIYNKVNWEDLTATSEDVKKEVLEHINADDGNIKNLILTRNELIEERKKINFPVFEYLKNQIKYLGFGESEDIHKTLEQGINSFDNKFEIKINSDKASERNNVDFTLKFSKSNQGGVFFNSYNATLTNEKGQVFSHNFSVNNGITAKESINLLEGRAVKTELNKTVEKISEDTGEVYEEKIKEPVFIKLKLAEEKNEYGNFKMEIYNKNYGVDTAKILDKSNVLVQSKEQKDFLIKLLEKGNIVPIKIKQGGHNPIEVKAILNPQYKTLNIYDNEMNRLNTNKPLQGLEIDNSHEKNKVYQQNISRSI